MFWISTRPDLVGEISQAGAFSQHKGMGMWLADTPEEERPKDLENDAEIQAHWDEELGDRRQEIVFIGLKNDMDEKTIRDQLDACLIKDYLSDKISYQKLDDPFPGWLQEEESLTQY